MDISIVTTLYHSASYIEEFYNRIRDVVEKITDNYEIIFVNDGSPDKSLNIAISLYKKDERIKIIDLSRNFGQHQSMMVGLAHAKGKLIFLIDCDLEEEPELLGKFYSEMKNKRADVVYGVRERRKGRLLERFSKGIFYAIFNLFSNYPVPPNQLNARLMSQRYVAGLIKHKEREFFMAGLWAITGFKQVALKVKKTSKGSSVYTLGRKISVSVNAITSFSNRPLIFIFYLGCIILFFSGLAAIYLIVRRLLGYLLEGWPSLIVSVWLLGGFTIFCLGIIGIYLSKIFIETKRRPSIIIKQIYEKNKTT